MRGSRMLAALTGVWGTFCGFPAMAAQPPDLSILSLQTPSAITNQAYPAIIIQSSVTNRGRSMPLNSFWLDTFYISTNSLLNATATELGSFSWSADWLVTGSYGPTAWLDLPLQIVALGIR